MKRAIFCFVMLMAMVFCANAQDTTQVDVKKASVGSLYFPFRVGYSLAPAHGISAGFGLGYKFNCGISLEGYGNVRQLKPSCCFATGIDGSYEFPMCKKVYPVIGLGIGGLVVVPDQIAFFTFDYHLGCNFVILEDFVDLGVEYRGDMIAMLQLQHSIGLVLRFYIGNQ